MVSQHEEGGHHLGFKQLSRTLRVRREVRGYNAEKGDLFYLTIIYTDSLIES